ncbi:hypothetical protein CPB83DRAFT_841029 [Crepidotus variabilis]|uniref:Uncharacterized protein n=1 Tax=Crepidotus variabilis TaxID=179855 RepID=A0A9P6JHZ8_9AGAR|nr:hypothetical protein CPB83DRAFT_841029 [Crepidotus variabilis]
MHDDGKERVLVDVGSGIGRKKVDRCDNSDQKLKCQRARKREIVFSAWAAVRMCEVRPRGGSAEPGKSSSKSQAPIHLACRAKTSFIVNEKVHKQIEPLVNKGNLAMHPLIQEAALTEMIRDYTVPTEDLEFSQRCQIKVRNGITYDLKSFSSGGRDKERKMRRVGGRVVEVQQGWMIEEWENAQRVL